MCFIKPSIFKANKLSLTFRKKSSLLFIYKWFFSIDYKQNKYAEKVTVSLFDLWMKASAEKRNANFKYLKYDRKGYFYLALKERWNVHKQGD